MSFFIKLKLQNKTPQGYIGYWNSNHEISSNVEDAELYESYDKALINVTKYISKRNDEIKSCTIVSTKDVKFVKPFNFKINWYFAGNTEIHSINCVEHAKTLDKAWHKAIKTAMEYCNDNKSSKILKSIEFGA